MATKWKINLAVPSLTSICSSLSKISHSSQLDLVRVLFSNHYIYGWIARYFKTHYALTNGSYNPLWWHFQGRVLHNTLTKKEARKRIHQGDNISWASTMLSNSKPYNYVDDNDAPELELNYFMSICFGYLFLRNKTQSLSSHIVHTGSVVNLGFIKYFQSNCVGVLPRGGSQESGESIFGPNPIKSSSTGKIEKEATSIPCDGVRVRLSSDLKKHPKTVVSVFNKKKVVLNYRKMIISILWTMIRSKLSGRDVDCASSIKEEVQVILEDMDDKDVDVSPLIKLIKSFFELAAIYNQAQLTLHDKDRSCKKRVIYNS
ncbi:hypothetical protein HAX54_021627 [Datura stramonium]|uniref:Uncharacterized protein n=1 Tax=Datura stramonium TaxID=4076 RepID=A0ABS8UV03_DATST|nr:hypothetical protein [Datura stramonium]